MPGLKLDSNDSCGRLTRLVPVLGRGLQNTAFLRVLSCLILLWLLAGWSGATCFGQSSEADEFLRPGTGSGSLEGIVLPLEAELYLQDGRGQPIFVPNVSFDEIRQFRSGKSGNGQASGYQFTGIEVTAVVDATVADVSGTFSVRLDQDATQADIGLAFGSCQLGMDQPQMKSNGARSRFYTDASGYRWFLAKATVDQPAAYKPATSAEKVVENSLPAADSQATERGGDHSPPGEDVVSPEYAITLSGKTRVTEELDRLVLRISLPQYPCRIKLALPPEAREVEVRNDEVIERLDTESSVELTVLSRGGEFSVAWRGAEASGRMSAIEATSKTTFEISEPEQLWRAKTNLVIRWYGASPTDEFYLSIPEGASWVTNPLGNNVFYSIAASTDESGAKELTVKLLQGFETTSINLDLEWVWRPRIEERPESELKTMVPSLAVRNVGVHSGTIEFLYPSTFSAVFSEGGGTRLMQQGRTAEGFGIQNSQLSFSRQPFELTATFREEKSLPTVRPTYHVTVDKNKLVMTAWLECSFDVNQQRLELDVDFGTWNLRVNTAKALSDPADPFTPDGDGLSVISLQDGTYRIIGSKPDPSSMGTNRRIEQTWRLTADRGWSPDDNGELNFAVPRIDRDPLGEDQQRDYASGTLIVSGEDNILLQWNETASAGELLPDTFSNEYQAYVARDFIRKPMVYRFPSLETIPSWAGRAQILPQLISAVEDIKVDVFDSQIVVTQAYELQIANSPLRNIQFAVRRDIAQNQAQNGPRVGDQNSMPGIDAAQSSTVARDPADEKDSVPAATNQSNLGLSVSQSNPRFFVGGILTSAELSATVSGQRLVEILGTDQPSALMESVGGNSVEWNIYDLTGAPELSGSSSLSVETSLNWAPGPTPTAAATDSNSLNQLVSRQTLVTYPLAIPLPPLKRAVVRRQVNIKSDLAVELQTGQESVTGSIAASTKKWQLPLSTESLGLNIQTPGELNRGSELSVGRSWLQTAIDGRRRLDRFVAKFESQAQQLTFKLPKEAFARNPTPKILLDGAVLRPPEATYVSADDSFVVRLPKEDERQQHTLELFYSVNSSLSNWTLLSSEPPSLEGAEYVGRFYWQLITPQTTHLASYPKELAPEWQWKWGGLWWYRASTQDERELGAALEAHAIESLPASCNRYLMSGQFPTEPMRCVVISRLMIWLPIGSLAIALATLVLNVPAVRKPLFGLLLAACIATLATVLPDLGVLLGQTAAISLGLVALVFATQAAIDSRVRRRSVFGGKPSALLESSQVASGRRLNTSAVYMDARKAPATDSAVATDGSN